MCNVILSVQFFFTWQVIIDPNKFSIKAIIWLLLFFMATPYYGKCFTLHWYWFLNASPYIGSASQHLHCGMSELISLDTIATVTFKNKYVKT